MRQGPTRLPGATIRSWAQVRSVYRDKLLVQLVASIWEPMLKLPILPALTFACLGKPLLVTVLQKRTNSDC
jgi:hypothetical protein